MKKNILLTFVILLMALCSSTKVWAEEEQGEAYAYFYEDEALLRFVYYAPGTTHSQPIGNIKSYQVQDNYTWTTQWSSEPIKKVEFDTSFEDYRPKSTAYWFFDCRGIESIEGLEYLNTSDVTNMELMFGTCNSIKELDLGGWDTRNVENMGAMFWECSSLTQLNVSDFNTINVKFMQQMFEGCKKLTHLDVSCFDTRNVETMISMFYGCESLKSLDISGFNTEKLRSIHLQFMNCKRLQELNLSSFNTSNVTTMYSMFENCESLSKITVSNNGWNTEKVKDSSLMFDGCIKLVGGKGTKYDSNHTDKAYAHIDGGTSDPGYLTEDTNGQFEDNSGQTRAYCVINNNVLTFYYDNKISSRQGLKFPVNKDDGRTTMPEWYYKRMYVNKAVIDPSFAAFQPTSTARWFYNFAAMTTIEGLSNLNTSQVTTMTEMFRFCDKLNNLDLSSFDTSNVTDMSFMVCYCTSLSNLNVSGFNTVKVIDMQHMFHMSPATEIDLRSFDTKNVKLMNTMFCDTKLKTIYVSDKWSTESVENSMYMFWGSTNLVGGKGTKYFPAHVGHDYARIDGGLCDPGYLTGDYQTGEPEPYAVLDDEGTLTFYYDWNKNCRDGVVFDAKFGNSWASGFLRITHANFDPSFAEYRPTSTAEWFYGLQNLESISNIQFLNTEQVVDMCAMFCSCEKLKTLDVSHFDTYNVSNMSEMFSRCISLTELDVTNFNTSNVRNMGSMFRRCESLKALDLSHFDTSNVTDMNGMFRVCEKLQVLDLSHFDTSNVTNMSEMFVYCKSLTVLDVSSFKTSNVTNMSGMFSNNKLLTELDISNFMTEKVTEMSSMFSGCTNLTTIFVSNYWSTDGLSSPIGMFNNNEKLVGGQGTRYADHLDNYTGSWLARIDGGPDNPGYFTYKEYVVPTSIEEVSTESGGNQGDVWYNLQGVKVDNPSKGIYILNGKKVVVK